MAVNFDVNSIHCICLKKIKSNVEFVCFGVNVIFKTRAKCNFLRECEASEAQVRLCYYCSYLSRFVLRNFAVLIINFFCFEWLLLYVFIFPFSDHMTVRMLKFKKRNSLVV